MLGVFFCHIAGSSNLDFFRVYGKKGDENPISPLNLLFLKVEG